MVDIIVQPPLPLDEDVVVRELLERTRIDDTTVIVEIGGNAGRTWADQIGVAGWHSIDPRNEPTEQGRVTSWAARGEAIPLPDGSADIVFSCNAFQFVDVRNVLIDAHRVLRPGGVLYTHFGPIWSGPDGHQLEYVRYRNEDLQFCKDTLLPPYAHLRFSPSELASILSSALPPDLVGLLVEHVYASSTINRLFAEDYLEIAQTSPFVIREYVVSDHLDYEITMPRYDDEKLTDVFDLETLGARTACSVHDRHSLGIRDIRLLLQKTDVSPDVSLRAN